MASCYLYWWQFSWMCLSCCVDYCRMPMDPGPCRSVMQRWYYDSNDGYCKRFNYGGCHGNGNRFESELKCRTHCQAKASVGK